MTSVSGDLPAMGALVEASDNGVRIPLDGSAWMMQGFLGDAWAWVAEWSVDRDLERPTPDHVGSAGLEGRVVASADVPAVLAVRGRAA